MCAKQERMIIYLFASLLESDQEVRQTRRKCFIVTLVCLRSWKNTREGFFVCYCSNLIGKSGRTRGKAPSITCMEDFRKGCRDCGFKVHQTSAQAIVCCLALHQSGYNNTSKIRFCWALFIVSSSSLKGSSIKKKLYFISNGSTFYA